MCVCDRCGACLTIAVTGEVVMTGVLVHPLQQFRAPGNVTGRDGPLAQAWSDFVPSRLRVEVVPGPEPQFYNPLIGQGSKPACSAFPTGADPAGRRPDLLAGP